MPPLLLASGGEVAVTQPGKLQKRLGKAVVVMASYAQESRAAGINLGPSRELQTYPPRQELEA